MLLNKYSHTWHCCIDIILCFYRLVYRGVKCSSGSIQLGAFSFVPFHEPSSLLCSLHLLCVVICSGVLLCGVYECEKGVVAFSPIEWKWVLVFSESVHSRFGSTLFKTGNGQRSCSNSHPVFRVEWLLTSYVTRTQAFILPFCQLGRALKDYFGWTPSKLHTQK